MNLNALNPLNYNPMTFVVYFLGGLICFLSPQVIAIALVMKFLIKQKEDYNSYKDKDTEDRAYMYFFFCLQLFIEFSLMFIVGQFFGPLLFAGATL